MFIFPIQKRKPSLPEFHLEDVALHNNKERGVWVTYKDGVYDVTDFLEMHPGGASRLMLAAGGAIDPFWAMYQQHNQEEIRSLLEGYRIGTLVRHLFVTSCSIQCIKAQDLSKDQHCAAAQPRPRNADRQGRNINGIAANILANVLGLFSLSSLSRRQ